VKITSEFYDIFGKKKKNLKFSGLNIPLFQRFFGRFALDDATHDEETLKAIRDNASGLRGIAGERLWTELKRIAEGRNAGSVLKVMLEQNIGQYLGKIKSVFFCLFSSFNSIKGIPSDADLSEIENHGEQCQQATPHAMTILTKLFRDINEVSQENEELTDQL
jgi:tRNA nucleotidyltransferase (CCA-adding enzyme)